jgi:hypothetical protein
LILILVSQSRHNQIPALGSAMAIGPISGLMFLCPALALFLRHGLCDRTASRAVAVKTGRRPPPQAARSDHDSREHGASLDQAGNYRSKPVPSRTDAPVCAAGYRPPLFPCSSGRKSHHGTLICNGFGVFMHLMRDKLGWKVAMVLAG